MSGEMGNVQHRASPATLAEKRIISLQTAQGNSRLDRGRCRHRRQELRRQQHHPQCRLSRDSEAVRWIPAVCRPNLAEWSSLSHEAWPGNEEHKDSWWSAEGGDQGEMMLGGGRRRRPRGHVTRGGTWGSLELGGVLKEATKGACHLERDMGITQAW